MRRLGVLFALCLASTALAADAVRATFRWKPGARFRVEVVIERLVRQQGTLIEGHKTLGAYDLVVERAPGGLRIEARDAAIVGDPPRDANALERLALGAWVPFHVDRHGAFIGLAPDADVSSFPATDLAEGARRHWADLVGSWSGRAFTEGLVAGDPHTSEHVTTDVACGALTCVRIERASSTVLAPEAVGDDGVLGWTDRLAVTFEPRGLVPHELATERAVALRLPGSRDPIERVDRSTRRYTALAP